jgi:hypothetical protein
MTDLDHCYIQTPVAVLDNKHLIRTLCILHMNTGGLGGGGVLFFHELIFLLVDIDCFARIAF